MVYPSPEKPELPPPELRSKGGGYMPSKVWRSFNFIIEVAVESPGDLDEAEAAEDAAEFCEGLAHACGRIHHSFASVIRVDEIGMIRPGKYPVIIRMEKPSGRRLKLTLPRGIMNSKNGYEKPKVEKAANSKKKLKRRV